MIATTRFSRLGALILTFSLAATAPALDYSISWYTTDGGGGYSAGGNFELEGTIGQPDAGAMIGGDFELVGGFWSGAGGSQPCPGDVDGDNDIDLSDLATLLANYGVPSGASYTDGDLDGDGDVDLSDLATLLAVYGTTCS